ncbi:hypothetical protein VP01_465g4 [Puccinia sorghi]|uniref:Uncharacterized protein n=1 Tax=Puccinia sorghi TaxID=27349 RepID=A0A0L6UN84_9BASI|nr:hypothetical protein VP01_465g4 [Puccinia sorghi]
MVKMCLSIYLPRILRVMDPLVPFSWPIIIKKIKYLKKKEAAGSQENTFHLIYHKMIKKVEECQEEALQCEALMMATFLHTAFRLRCVAHCWSEREKHLQLLLENNFNKKDTPKVDKNNIFEFFHHECTPLFAVTVHWTSDPNIFMVFNAPPNSEEIRELEIYIKNMDRLATPAAKDQKSLLIL